eukprot:5625395-Lingulodinium_polyedra.AAC.1
MSRIREEGDTKSRRKSPDTRERKNKASGNRAGRGRGGQSTESSWLVDDADAVAVASSDQLITYGFWPEPL